MQNAEAFQCGVFGKICKNMGGLGIRRKRIHEELKASKARIQKWTTRMNAVAYGRRRWKCGRIRSKTNIARHVRACSANEAEGGVRRNVRPEEGLARVYKPNEKACRNCGRTLSVTNMRRHHKGCRMFKRGGEKCVYGRVTPIKSSLCIAWIA